MNEWDIVNKIRSGETDFGPCSTFLASEYDLNGPVIGHESIELIIREEEIESEDIKRVTELLGSDEWKESVNFLGGYSSKRSGQINSFP